jgi:hypothetical protein
MQNVENKLELSSRQPGHSAEQETPAGELGDAVSTWRTVAITSPPHISTENFQQQTATHSDGHGPWQTVGKKPRRQRKTLGTQGQDPLHFKLGCRKPSKLADPAKRAKAPAHRANAPNQSRWNKGQGGQYNIGKPADGPVWSRRPIQGLWQPTGRGKRGLYQPSFSNSAHNPIPGGRGEAQQQGSPRFQLGMARSQHLQPRPWRPEQMGLRPRWPIQRL